MSSDQNMEDDSSPRNDNKKGEDSNKENPKDNNNDKRKEELSKYFSIFYRYPKSSLLILLLILIALPLISNFVKGNPLLIGPENYYHLYQAQISTGITFYYYPLHWFTSYVPEKIFFLLPISITFLTIILWFSCARRLELKEEFTFVFTLLLITSPVFIFTSITFSFYTLFCLFLVSGFWLLSSDAQLPRYIAILPFVLTTIIDVCTSFFVLILLLIYYLYYYKRSLEHKRMLIIIIGVTIFGTIFNSLLLRVPLLQEPFHPTSLLPELISDLGGESGIPFFTLLLALLAVSFSWKDKKYRYAYLILPLVIIAYLLSQHFLFPLFLVVAFFSALGLIHLFSSSWSLPSLKKFTFWLLMLGIFFSLLTYMNRVSDTGPSAVEVDSLHWIRDNPQDNSNQRILSAPENGYYLEYFAQRQPLYEYHLASTYPGLVNTSEEIFASTYISTTFPLLQQYDLYLFYLDPKTRERYPSDQGLFFLLKNERFKMLYSHENIEVWQFE
ncbi:MAG: hypothetical protein AABX04_07895 [Nanoarchaeota archaeon]